MTEDYSLFSTSKTSYIQKHDLSINTKSCKILSFMQKDKEL